jgi:hypothetical protein
MIVGAVADLAVVAQVELRRRAMAVVAEKPMAAAAAISMMPARLAAK